MFTYMSKAETFLINTLIIVFCSMIKMGIFSVQLTVKSVDSKQKTIYMYMASTKSSPIYTEIQHIRVM